MSTELPPAELSAGSDSRTCNTLRKVRKGHSTLPPSVLVRIYPTVRTLGEFLTDIVTSAHDCGAEEAALSLTRANDTEGYRALLSHTYAALSHLNRESAPVLNVLNSWNGRVGEEGEVGPPTESSGRRSQLEVGLDISFSFYLSRIM